MNDVLDIAVLSVSEHSTRLVSADDMCKLAENTGLHLLQEEELALLPRQRASVCVVPYLGAEKQVQYALLESLPERVNIRPMQVASSAGWSPKCPWLFKR